MPGQPKYQTVAATLRREIAEGVFGEGQLLMTEEELKVASASVVRRCVRRLPCWKTTDWSSAAAAAAPM